jgi:hypothetical protein
MFDDLAFRDWLWLEDEEAIARGDVDVVVGVVCRSFQSDEDRRS